MSTRPYRFAFEPALPLDEAEQTLQLTLLALEGLYGQAAVRLEGRYAIDVTARAIVVDGAGKVGSSVVRVFTALLTREFGEDAFSVCRRTTDAADLQPEAVA